MGREGEEWEEGSNTQLPIPHAPCPMPHAQFPLFLLICVNTGGVSFNYFSGAGAVNH